MGQMRGADPFNFYINTLVKIKSALNRHPSASCQKEWSDRIDLHTAVQRNVKMMESCANHSLVTRNVIFFSQKAV